jgi:hypothetical protein
MVKKSDLKNGMLVEVTTQFNKKETYIVVKDTFGLRDTLISTDGWLDLDNYDNYLQLEDKDDGYTITAVYFPEDTQGWSWFLQNYMWRRVEVTAPKMMTLSEIEDALGYAIVIKEEKNETEW